jgi:hypothetical protein
MLAVRRACWIPLRWQISMVVGEGRMLAVLPAVSVRVMVLRVREKATSWSLGASVMRTGTATAGDVMLVEEPGELELEHPASRAARVREARARGL